MDFTGPLHGPQIRLPVGRTETPTVLHNAYKQDTLPKLHVMVTQLFKDPASVTADDLERAYGLVHHYCSSSSSLRKICRQDLLDMVTATLDDMRTFTLSKPNVEYIRCLTFALANSDTVISSLCTIYRTLDKQTVSAKQRVPVRDQLEDLYRDRYVAEPSIQKRLAMLLPEVRPALAASPDDWASPANLQKLVSGLHSFYPTYNELNRSLFELYIPCLTPVKCLDEEQQLIKQQLEVLSRCYSHDTPVAAPNGTRGMSVQGSAPSRQKRRLTFS